MNIKKTVNVKFNSNFKLSGTNDDATYYIDWSAMLKNDGQHYSVIFSYISQAQLANVNDQTLMPSVYTNIY